jgi:hypothetical protein
VKSITVLYPNRKDVFLMETLWKMIQNLALAAANLIVLGAIVGYPTMLLWNWLVPSIFGLREINFGEALGLLLLAGFLFKSPVAVRDGNEQA